MPALVRKCQGLTVNKESLITTEEDKIPPDHNFSSLFHGCNIQSINIQFGGQNNWTSVYSPINNYYHLTLLNMALIVCFSWLNIELNMINF